MLHQKCDFRQQIRFRDSEDTSYLRDDDKTRKKTNMESKVKGKH